MTKITREREREREREKLMQVVERLFMNLFWMTCTRSKSKGRAKILYVLNH